MTRATAAPRFIAPQLATLVDVPPVGRGWVFEVKYDGYRLEAIVHDRQARLLTRRGKNWTKRFPGLAAQLGRLPVRSAILDGEVVVLDRARHSRFALLQQSLDAERPQDLTYFVFDLLHLNGIDLRALPLAERRRQLSGLLGRAPAATRKGVRLGRRLSGRGDRLLRAACKARLEGIIAKERDARYQSRRRRAWLKIKCGRRQEFVVVGFTAPRGSRIGIGSLLLGVYDHGRLRYAGRVGTGFDEAMLRTLHRRLLRIARETAPPAVRAVQAPAAARWVRPSMVVEVSFTEWTRAGMLRHPVFQGIRLDKPASQVHRERSS